MFHRNTTSLLRQKKNKKNPICLARTGDLKINRYPLQSRALPTELRSDDSVAPYFVMMTSVNVRSGNSLKNIIGVEAYWEPLGEIRRLSLLRYYLIFFIVANHLWQHRCSITLVLWLFWAKISSGLEEQQPSLKNLTGIVTLVTLISTWMES